MSVTNDKRREWALRKPHYGNDIGDEPLFYLSVNIWAEHRYYGVKSVDGENPYAQPRPEFVRHWVERQAERFRNQLAGACMLHGLTAKQWVWTFDEFFKRETAEFTKWVNLQTLPWDRSDRFPVLRYQSCAEAWLKKEAERRASKWESHLPRFLKCRSNWCLGHEEIDLIDGFTEKPEPPDHFAYFKTSGLPFEDMRLDPGKAYTFKPGKTEDWNRRQKDYQTGEAHDDLTVFVYPCSLSTAKNYEKLCRQLVASSKKAWKKPGRTRGEAFLCREPDFALKLAERAFRDAGGMPVIAKTSRKRITV